MSPFSCPINLFKLGYDLIPRRSQYARKSCLSTLCLIASTVSFQLTQLVLNNMSYNISFNFTIFMDFLRVGERVEFAMVCKAWLMKMCERFVLIKNLVG